MKNKILLAVILFLIPIVVISFMKKETNFILPENPSPEEETPKKEVNVRLKIVETGNVVELSLEDYILGVVAAEMPASFEEEALKAQAVASRTFALEKLSQQKDAYDLENTTNDQAYIDDTAMQIKWGKDYTLYKEKIKKAVDATARQILTYEDQMIKAFYFAFSNGKTENSESVFKEEKPYLKSVESKWDNDETISKFKTTIYMPKQDFCAKLVITCQSLKIEEPKRNATHHVETIKINDKEFAGTDVRKKLTIRSTDFTMKYYNETIEITTYGYGHNVGMSQYGANGMAKEGSNYEEILKHYYQGVELSSY